MLLIIKLQEFNFVSANLWFFSLIHLISLKSFQLVLLAQGFEPPINELSFILFGFHLTSLIFKHNFSEVASEALVFI